jgi:CRP-like cAMP-binding protein
MPKSFLRFCEVQASTLRGKTILREGDHAEKLYLILDGSVIGNG